MSRRVMVTGAGVVSSLGYGRLAFSRALAEGRSGVGPVRSFDPEGIGRTLAAEVTDFRTRDHLSAAEARRMGRCSAYCVAATRMALTDAGLSLPGAEKPERMSVVIGTTMGEVDVLSKLDHAWIREGREAMSDREIPRYGTTLLPIHVARAVGARGMVLTLPAACAAGNYAVGFAADLIRTGRADVAITGAAEIVDKIQYAGFVRLGAMAPEKCQPFDLNRQGFILGEGAGIVVLESEEHAVRRGANVLAELGGYGLACDAFHITRPHPEGTGTIHSIREALERSGLRASDVDFINAHGTATKANDAIEALSIRAVFGTHRVPVSSIKSMIGHCMGASSALELISCIETIRTGEYPPTIHYDSPDPECDLDVVANTMTRGAHRVVLNNALAFGGYDAVMLVAQPGVIPDSAPILT